MTKRFGFPRCRRIRLRKDFRRIFQRRCSASDRRLVLFVDHNDVGHPRLGISAGKRLGGAVARTREKRRLREAFRQCQNQLADMDMVCVIRTCGHSVAEYEAGLLKLAGEARRKLARS